MSDLARIVNEWVGREWSTQFDCWDFVSAVYLEAYTIMLPRFPHVDATCDDSCRKAFESGKSSPLWGPVDGAWSDGDVILMGRTRRPVHCGIWIASDGGMVAHNGRKNGVVCQDLRRLRLLGWGHLSAFRHRDIS